ncbi:MAG: 1-acyl-sn-glycerol-3-phosphate acyltransferase [Candidatus Lokiarchaeota archaeon]
MVETSEESKKDQFAFIGGKDNLSTLTYGLVSGISGGALKLFTDLKIEGKENIPLMGKAIITTISDNVIRDLVVISQLSGRQIHFMLDPKLIRHQVAGPVLKFLGMFRSTESKDDMEPIEKVFELLNEKGDLVAMTPESKFDYEIQVKSMAAIIKFAIAADAPIIPVAISTRKNKLFDLINVDGLTIRVGNPLEVEKKLNRDKYRDQRYELAEGIIKIINSMKSE